MHQWPWKYASAQKSELEKIHAQQSKIIKVIVYYAVN